MYPGVIFVPWVIVEQSIAAIKNGAGKFAFCNKKPTIIERKNKPKMLTKANEGLSNISGVKALSLTSKIITGVAIVRVKTLMD